MSLAVHVLQIKEKKISMFGNVHKGVGGCKTAGVDRPVNTQGSAA